MALNLGTTMGLQNMTLNTPTLGTTLMGTYTRWKGDVTVGAGGPPSNYSVYGAPKVST